MIAEETKKPDPEPDPPSVEPAPELRTVQKADTVSGQMENLLATNSPYLAVARKNAQRTANSRGLINSTMAARQGEDAAISAAMPIAQQDASSYFDQGKTNQGIVNRFRENRQNTELNKELQTQQFGHDSALSKQDAGQRLALSEQEALQRSALSKQESGQTLTLSEQEALQRAELSKQEAGQKSGLLEQEGAQKLEQMAIDDAHQRALVTLEQQLDMEKDANAYALKQSLETVLADQKLSNDMKVAFTQEMARIMTETQASIGAIGTSDRTAEQQAAAIDQLIKQRDYQIVLMQNMMQNSTSWEWFTVGGEPPPPLPAGPTSTETGGGVQTGSTGATTAEPTPAPTATTTTPAPTTGLDPSKGGSRRLDPNSNMGLPY